MSGIAGIIRFDGVPVETGLIEAMTSAMSYRGPDGINHWVQGSVALGQCMLRTTAESLEETQPHTNEDESLVLVMDGRVDNWEELREELLRCGTKLRTRADAELVLRSYEIWGQDCLPHIDGDFAFVIWDARKNEAFCARDPMGNKPFNYHWDGTKLVFASDLHPILETPWVQQEPNLGMIAEILADKWYSLDETLWKGVMRLPAANFMNVGANSLKPEIYWQPDLNTTLNFKSDDEYITHYRALFEDTVRRLSRSHRTVAFEVSGGLDSSANFCVAERLRRLGKISAPKISGYVLDFAEYSEADDLNYARSVGDFLDLKINEIEPSLLPISWFRERAYLFKDFPGFSNSSWNLNLIKAAASEGACVIITGLFADQYLCGSTAHYEEEMALYNFTAAYDCFKNDIAEIGLVRTMNNALRKGLLPFAPRSIRAALSNSWRVIHGRPKPLNDPDWLTPLMQAVLRPRKVAAQERLERLRLQVTRRGQRDLIWRLYDPYDQRCREVCERIHAYAGFEVRHPFSSKRFVEFAFQTPERLRSRGVATKFIHRMAMQSGMPQAVLERTGKADFTHVFVDFLLPLTGDIQAIARNGFAAYVDSTGIERLIECLKRTPHLGDPIWKLMGLLGCEAAIAVAIPEK